MLLWPRAICHHYYKVTSARSSQQINNKETHLLLHLLTVRQISGNIIIRLFIIWQRLLQLLNLCHVSSAHNLRTFLPTKFQGLDSILRIIHKQEKQENVNLGVIQSIIVTLHCRYTDLYSREEIEMLLQLPDNDGEHLQSDLKPPHRHLLGGRIGGRGTTRWF